jgi:hypothetical protein
MSCYFQFHNRLRNMILFWIAEYPSMIFFFLSIIAEMTKLIRGTEGYILFWQQKNMCSLISCPNMQASISQRFMHMLLESHTPCYPSRHLYSDWGHSDLSCELHAAVAMFRDVSLLWFACRVFIQLICIRRQIICLCASMFIFVFHEKI